MAFLTALVLSILVAAVYILFMSNVTSHEYARNRIAARFTAEAGARLAVHHLSLRTSMPLETEPFYMPDDSSGWIDMPGLDGKALVVMDPRNNVQNPFAIRGVEIRSRGRFLSGEMDVKIHYAPDAPSRYALLVHRRIPPGFFEDGRVVNGPVHSNGEIHFSSVTPDSSDDPFAQEISTTSDGGFIFADAGPSLVPHPAGSSVWVRPYRSHRAGSPSWNVAADAIDFQRVEDHFRSVRSEAYGMGTVVSGVKRIILDRSTLLMKNANVGPITVLELGEERNLVYILNGAMPVYIKSGQSTNMPLTIVATGDVYLMGSIRGGAAGPSGPLAIVSMGDIVVAADPGYTGALDWSPPWDIQTEGNLSVAAYLAAPSGELRNQSLLYPPGRMYLTISGGLMEERMGRLGTAMSGYRLEIDYDNGLFTVIPPYFPILENWIMTSWVENPDFGSAGIESDQY